MLFTTIIVGNVKGVFKDPRVYLVKETLFQDNDYVLFLA